MSRFEDLIRQYEVAEYVDGMEPKAQELFSLAFNGKVFPRDVWDWRFLKNPCMNRRITTLWDGDTLVALTALTPAYATIDQKEAIAAASGTTMARREYVGASLQLFRECMRRNRDISFIYAFPNRNSYSIFIRELKHNAVGEMAFWSCVPHPMKSTGRIAQIRKFTDAHGELYKNIVKDYSFITNRTAEYLNWRFIDKPSPRYEIYSLMKGDTACGYIVIDEYSENGLRQEQIIDYIADTEETLYELFAHAINLAWERRCDSVKTWMSSQRYQKMLTELNFSYGEHPFPMTVWQRGLDIHEAYITLADSDVF